MFAVNGVFASKLVRILDDRRGGPRNHLREVGRARRDRSVMGQL